MEASESTPQTSNDDEKTISSNENQPVQESQYNKEVTSVDDVKTKREVTAKVKRVSFHFGTALSARREQNTSDSKDLAVTTIQNIYDSKTLDPDHEDGNLVKSNSTKGRINKSAYIKLHRHSFTSTGNTSVDKLKGRYENIAKQTDNNSKSNIVTRTKANTDNNSTNSAKNPITTDKQGKSVDLNLSKEKSADVLKAEFINSPATPKADIPEPSKSEDISIADQAPAEGTKTDTAETTKKLLKTTSNIEKLQNTLATKLSNDTIEKLRNKYSPASFGYPRDTSGSKLQKKVLSEDTDSKIPIPAPRVSATPKDIEQNKSEANNFLQDAYTESKQSLSPLNKEKIHAVTVKLVSVPEVSESTSTEQVIKPQISEENSEGKNEKSNAVINDTVLQEDKPKIKPPILARKPVIPQILAKQTLPQQLAEEVESNKVEEIAGVELQVIYDNIEFAEPEDKHFIVRRSSSEDSIDKVENFFSSEIIMDKKSKDKKRSNSFKKILTGGLFGRDKKKGEDEKVKHKKKDNAVFAENVQNESQAFNRNSSHRHTIDNTFSRREVHKNAVTNSSSGPLYYYSPQTQSRRVSDDVNYQNRYTEMKGSSAGSSVSNRHPKYCPEEYVPMDNGNQGGILENNQTSYMNVSKYIDTSSSSSNTIESENRNCTYQNALIAQAELRQIRENEYLQQSPQRSGIPVNLKRRKTPASQENRFISTNKHPDSPEMFSENPLHSPDSSKNVQLVKPKALIPINSERPLPNPYRNYQDKTRNNGSYQNLENIKTLDRNLNVDNTKPYPYKNNLYTRTDDVADKTANNAVVVEDVYGTVFDHISSESNIEYLKTRSLSPQRNVRSGSNCSSPSTKIPLSPRSLEASKLKLPPNREKVELQPRIRSPIPQTKISTDKIIATELLRNKKSPTSNSPVLRTESQDKPTSQLQRSPEISSNRSASYQSTNIYENSPNLSHSRIPMSPMSNLSADSHNVNLAHSTPQSDSQNSQNEYLYLNRITPIPRSKPPLSPRDVSVVECLQAAEWQRKQKELDKSPALEIPQQITTNVLVHVNPEEERPRSASNYSPIPPQVRQRTPTYQFQPQTFKGQPASPRSLNSSVNNVRAHTPVQQYIPSPLPKSPEKQQMLQSVEAFYWRELKKLKEKEKQEFLNYRQQQLHVYGYVEDPIYTRRSRSVSPSMQRGRRSLSLPREVRPMPVTGRSPLISPEPIPEGRPVIAKKPITLPSETAYGQVRPPVQRNPNFIRNTFERSTIGPIGMNKNSKLLYENYHPDAFAARASRQQNYAPIFKRGSLTVSLGAPETPLLMSKKVSFSSTQNPNNTSSWPTKNGFTKSPPTRRVEREVSMDDDVFLPNMSNMALHRQLEEVYIRNHAKLEPVYSTKQQLNQKAREKETAFGSKVLKREVDYVDRNPREDSKTIAEPLYGRTGPKHITISNKVCDIYGNIHDSGQRSAVSPQNYSQIQKSGQVGEVAGQNYGQIRQVGYMYGQLQQPQKVSSPVVLRQSYNQLNSPQNNFVRGTRLTASVNDMYKRYPIENQRYQFDPRHQPDAIYANERTIEAPNRPLSPVPERKDSRTVSTRKMVRGYIPVSDTESGSEAGEVQRILQSGTKQKNFSVIGK